jgi:hypothetical protein
MSRPTKARSCEGKTRYDKRDEAVRALFVMAAQTGTSARQLEAYHCTHCGGWHFGHRRKNAGRSRG